MFRNVKKSLVSRILFYVLPPCILLFLVSLSVFYFYSKNTIEEMTHENALMMTQKTVLKTEQVLVSIEKITGNSMWQLEQGMLNEAEAADFTRRVLGKNSEVLGCAVAYAPELFPQAQKPVAYYSYRTTGNVAFKTLDNTEYSYSLQDWYQIPSTLGKAVWTEPYYDIGGADALISTYAVPFYRTVNGVKQVAGVLAVDVSLDWLTDIVSSVKILETGYASLISQNGTFVTHQEKDLIMNQTLFSYASEFHSPELRELGRKMKQGESGFVTLKLRGVDKVIAYTPIPQNHWTLMVVFPEAEMYAPLYWISLVLFILLVLGLGLLTFVVVRMVAVQLSPLKGFTVAVHKIAEGNFDVPLPDIQSEDEMRDLHDSFEHMQSDLKQYIADLQETTSAKEKIESELRIAREIQMGMIPKTFPAFPELEELDLFAQLEPAKEVGGDLYDFFLLDETHLCFAIGDVSGKGVPASLFMAVTRTLLRSISPKETSPANMVKILNTSLSKDNESSMFVTFFLGILDLKTGNLTYANAGHNPPMIVRQDGTVESFEITKNIPIGLFEEHSYEEHEKTLGAGDMLFLYTDGVTEAENAQKELFSDERLIKSLESCHEKDPERMIACIRKHVMAHVQGNEQSDDLTMLSLIYNGEVRDA
jgi:sigma-B regulation protein RsbU (phosphoserine phosphatase)